MNKDAFIEWLQNYSDLSEYSIGRYANAIDKLSSELGNYGLESINLFELTQTTFIDTLLNNAKFQKKNNEGNRMYSAALKNFKNYIVDYHDIDPEVQAELLKEEMEFEKYLKENHADVNEINIEDKPQNKPEHRKVNNKKIWIRNPKCASEAVASARYLCEFDNQHQHFTSKFSQNNYVEAHHLIPMSFQEQFDNSLDIHANTVSLCLVCHKKIHFGLFENKRELLDKLFSKRKERLQASGINVDIARLYSYYQD